MQLEEHQQVPLWIVEGAEAGHLFERIAAVQILKRSGVKVVPCGIPAGLVGGEFGYQFLCSEVIAQGGQVGNQRNLVAADGDQQALAVGMLIHILSELPGRIHKCVLGISGIVQCLNAVDARSRQSQCDHGPAQAADSACAGKQRLSPHRHHKKAEESHHGKVARLGMVLIGHEEDIAGHGPH